MELTDAEVQMEKQNFHFCHAVCLYRSGEVGAIVVGLMK
jgi:hypothetical protein